MSEQKTVKRSDEPEIQARLSHFADKVEALAKEMCIEDWHLLAIYHVERNGKVLSCPLAAYGSTEFSKTLSAAMRILLEGAVSHDG